jgi:hypothetical protein
LTPGAFIGAPASARRASAVLLVVSSRPLRTQAAVAGYAWQRDESVTANRNDVGRRWKSA